MTVRMPPRWLGLASLLALLAAPCLASNMGFALSWSLPASSVSTVVWLALPWQYAPASPTTAESLCQDLGGSGKVAAVVRWDEASSRMVSYACGSAVNNFTLIEGVAYGVRPQLYQAIAALIVGAHDDAFSYGLGPFTGSSLTWVSVPYHQAIPDIAGTAGVVDAEDLCRSVGPTLLGVVRWDATSGFYLTYACGSVFDTPFPIVLGVGYGLVNAAGQTIAWQPPHY